MGFYGWAPYVTVAQRRAKAQKQLEKMKKKKGLNVQPVQLEGKKIAVSFWGKGWCDHMESFSDYANRLPRGRSYVRNGSVCHLEIRGGEIKAMVSGSSLYNVSISIAPLKTGKWEQLKRSCSGRIGSLIDLLRGKLDQGVMEVVTHRKDGLFPLPGEMKFDCDCPDWAGMCKHVAAVLYGVGARLDHSPEMLFLLRGVNHEELIDVTAAISEVAKSGTSRRRIVAEEISDIFGIELAEAGPVDTIERPALNKTKRRSEKPLTENAKEGKPTKEKPSSVNKKETVKRGRGGKGKPAFLGPLTGDVVRELRLRLGETQARLAARLGVTSASISQWERKGKDTIRILSVTEKKLREVWSDAS